MNSGMKMGFDSFVWFVGVVEDRLDPKKLGRLRVRILDVHTADKNKIPTEELHWAYPVMPLTSASMNGIGDTPIGTVEGTWVFGFFRDSENCQEAMILGTLVGIPQEYPYPKSITTGFLDGRKDLRARPRKIKERIYKNDGTGVELKDEEISQEGGQSYPRREHPLGCVIKEPDINRLARNEKINDTIVEIKRKNLDTNIPVADGTFWSEPQTPYDSSYPYNRVIETESGHVIELDDTKGGERIHFWHRSGTFTEIYPDGIKVEKIVGNEYKIVLEEKYEHIQNRYNLTIDGPFNVYVSNNCNVIVLGDANIQVKGNMITKVQGNYTLDASGSVSIRSGSTTVIGAGNSVQLKGSSVTSNPPISQSKESLKASGLGVVIPAPPQPTSASVSIPGEQKKRDFPREVPEYKIEKENYE